MDTELIDLTLVKFPRFAANDIAVEPLEKGGSDRKFYRMKVKGGVSLILAKYGRQREENRHYVAIAAFLRRLGIRVPEIYFHDESEGLIWMEDLGDRDLWSFRAESWEVRRELYQGVLDEAIRLHTRAHLEIAAEPPKLQAEFNAELYRWEQNYFVENCLQRRFGLDETTIEERCCRARLGEIADFLHTLPRVFVHRDFQSQNIVIKEGAACLIDFQGMRPGLAQYDLASLLLDPYVQLPSVEQAELLRYYVSRIEETGESVAPNFAEVFDLCAMQRLMQALGAYGFLGLAKERTHFLPYIEPAVSSLRQVVGRIGGLESLGELLGELGR